MTHPILDSAQITELALITLRSIPEEQAASILDSRLRVLEDAWKRSYIERGIILVEVQERGLWRLLAGLDGVPYHSFEAWVCGAAPHSRSDCFAAMRAVRELADIPRYQLESMPRCNVEVLRSLSSGVRSKPGVIEAAQALPEKEFREHIRASHPGQHIEGKRRLILTLSDGDYQMACEVLDDVGAKLGLSDREGEFLALLIDYRQEQVRS
jgi:hypothetical protein